jgi:hypothetical protein
MNIQEAIRKAAEKKTERQVTVETPSVRSMETSSSSGY